MLPVYIAQRKHPICEHVQLTDKWKFARLDKSYFYKILFIYLKEESQYFEYFLKLLNNRRSYIFIKV